MTRRLEEIAVWTQNPKVTERSCRERGRRRALRDVPALWRKLKLWPLRLDLEQLGPLRGVWLLRPGASAGAAWRIDFRWRKPARMRDFLLLPCGRPMAGAPGLKPHWLLQGIRLAPDGMWLLRRPDRG